MRIGSNLKHALGIVMGIFIPAGEHTTNLRHLIQQKLAKLYGTTAADLAKKLAVGSTGTSIPIRFPRSKAIVATAKRDGVKGDATILGDFALDVARAADRTIEPNIASSIIALGSALTAILLVAVAAEWLRRWPRPRPTSSPRQRDGFERSGCCRGVPPLTSLWCARRYALRNLRWR